jgi:hypothetical protein
MGTGRIVARYVFDPRIVPDLALVAGLSGLQGWLALCVPRAPTGQEQSCASIGALWQGLRQWCYTHPAAGPEPPLAQPLRVDLGLTGRSGPPAWSRWAELRKAATFNYAFPDRAAPACVRFFHLDPANPPLQDFAFFDPRMLCSAVLAAQLALRELEQGRPEAVRAFRRFLDVPSQLQMLRAFAALPADGRNVFAEWAA